MAKIIKAHGSGGQYSRELVRDIFLKHFDNQALAELSDAAILPLEKGRIAFATDSHVIQPIFYPGGNIGKLAVAGTVNDLAVSGAVPKYLSCGLILEEGFDLEDLEKIVLSMAETARLTGVKIVTGDTKVVGHGEADKIYINTSGIGIIPENVDLSPKNIQIGDSIILSGNIGDHATAILLARENFTVHSTIQSDCHPINAITEKLIREISGVRVMRDPTRGGVVTVLNEFVENRNFGIRLFEETIPVSQEVMGVCEPLGLDPLYLANEGKFICIVAREEAVKSLELIQCFDRGKEARIIGEVIENPKSKVLLRTQLGTDRVLNVLSHEILPRIC
ncbi:MAG: hydrogenase expression/formation protein HypE [Candidatus Marinimicrobia bacterium]|nr:hydrogenase expression/formation protein HypE [Candidatus Neomarinimicrobiota bacterium]